MEASELQKQAEKLLQVLQRQARRPYVVELTGTPKSGKTTSLATLQAFFKQCGYRVQVQKERAGDCPLPMKGHFFFNAWTTATMLAEVIAAVETRVDIIFLDRAFFDALIWLELQFRRGQVSADESRTFSDFVLLERWRSLVDVTILMTAEPSVALKRENQNAIVPREGSVMNADALNDFNSVLADVRATHLDKFSFIDVDSSNSDIVSANKLIAEQILRHLEAWADPPVAVVARAEVEQLFGKNVLISDQDRVGIAWQTLAQGAKPMQRSRAELSCDVVQLISCGICLSAGAALVLQRSVDDEKTGVYGPYTLWKGCHLEMKDESTPTVEVAMSSLKSRLESELHLKELPVPVPLALAWDPNMAAESNHLGLLFALKIDSDPVIKSFKTKEFRRGARGHKLVGRLATGAELEADLAKFESWSAALIRGKLIS
jgi:predicted ATPase/predicted NUDIX family phosphoesterase